MTSIAIEPAETLPDDLIQQTFFDQEAQPFNNQVYHDPTSPLLIDNSSSNYLDTTPDETSSYQSDSSASDLKDEFKDLPSRLQPSYRLLLFGLTIYVTGFFASMPSTIDALVYMVCRQRLLDTTSSLPLSSDLTSFANVTSKSPYSDPRCFGPDISAAVGTFQSYQAMFSAIFGTITIPMLSSLSDRIGRKPIILWTATCSLANMAIILACTLFDINYNLMLLGSIIEGLGGSTTIMSILSSSYISDCIKEHHRAPVFSISEALFYGSMAIGPFLGSIFLSLFNHRIPALFGVTAVAQLLFMALVYFALAESRTPRARRLSTAQFNSWRESSGKRNSDAEDETISVDSKWHTLVWQSLVALKDSLVMPLKAFALPHIPRSQPRTRLNVYILLSTQSMLMEVVMCIMPLLFLYVKTVFGWTSVETGYFVSILGVSKFVGLAGLFPPLLRYLRAHYDHSATRVDRADMLLLRCGLLGLAGLYLLLAEAPSGKMFLVLAVGFMVPSINSPVLRNALVKHADQGHVGSLLGLSQFISRSVSIVMPLGLAAVYRSSVGVRPQLVLELAAGVIGLIFVGINFMSVKE